MMDMKQKEQGCFFTFDFSKVYWNSKLQQEHTSLVESFAKGSVICDMFAGVGPFAIPAAKMQLCTVFANDLNPNSFHFLKVNAEKNKVQDRVVSSNEDGLDFMKRMIHTEKVVPDHVIMNLPASSVEFLGEYDDMRNFTMNSSSKGMLFFIFFFLSSDLFSFCFRFRAKQIAGLLEVFDGCEKRPLIHVYTFSSAEDGEEGVHRKVEEFLGAPLSSPKIVNVRSVSPKKDMFRVSFYIPLVGIKRSRT
jgi:tRNA (guanine37-N1)-methyltransferase